MLERDNGVVAERHGLFQRVVFITCHVALNVRLAGDHSIAPVTQDVCKQDGGAFTRVVDVGLEAHAEHGDLCTGLHIARDAVSDPCGLAVVDQARLIDQRRDILEFLVDEPRIDGDAVSADADAGRVDIDARVAVGKLDELEHTSIPSLSQTLLSSLA